MHFFSNFVSLLKTLTKVEISATPSSIETHIESLFYALLAIPKSIFVALLALKMDFSICVALRLVVQDTVGSLGKP